MLSPQSCALPGQKDVCCCMFLLYPRPRTTLETHGSGVAIPSSSCPCSLAELWKIMGPVQGHIDIWICWAPRKGDAQLRLPISVFGNVKLRIPKLPAGHVPSPVQRGRLLNIKCIFVDSDVYGCMPPTIQGPDHQALN